MSKWIHSLLVVCLLTCFMFEKKAEAAAPFVVPAGIEAAAAVYVGTALGVAAVGGVLGYEYSDQIREHAYDTWFSAQQTIKDSWKASVDAAIEAKTGVVNIANDFWDWLNGKTKDLGEAAIPKPMYSGDLTYNVHYRYDQPTRIFPLTPYKFSTTDEYLVHEIGFTYNLTENYVYALYNPPHPIYGLQQKIIMDTQYLVNMSGFNVAAALMPLFPLRVVQYIPPSSGSFKTLSQILPQQKISIPPITSFTPSERSTGDPLSYDWTTGNYTKNGQPYTNMNDIIWNPPAPIIQDVNGVKKIGYIQNDIVYPVDDYITPTIDDPYHVELDDYIVSIPTPGYIDMVYPASIPYELDIVYFPPIAVQPLDYVVSPADLAIVTPDGIVIPQKVGTGTLTISDPAGVVPRTYEIPIVISNSSNLPAPSGGGSPPPPPGGWNIFDWLKYLLDLIVWIILAIVYLVTLASSQLTQLNNAVGGLKTVLITVFSTTPPLVWTLIGFAIVMSIISGLMRRK